MLSRLAIFLFNPLHSCLGKKTFNESGPIKGHSCYHGDDLVTCFTNRNNTEICQKLRHTANSANIDFQLYFGIINNTRGKAVIDMTNITLISGSLNNYQFPQSFDSSLQLKVILHGFGGNCGQTWVQEMITNLILHQQVNM